MKITVSSDLLGCFRLPSVDSLFLYIRKARSSVFIKNVFKVYWGDIVSKIISVAALLLIIRGLSIADYAAYTVFYTILSLMPNIVGSGINTALVRYSAEYFSKENQRPYGLYFLSFLFQIALYILLGVVMYAFGDFISNLLFGEKSFLTAYRLGLIGGLGFLIAQSGRSIFQAEERFGVYIKTLWLKQISIFIPICLLFLFDFLNFDTSARVMIIINLLVGLFIVFYIFRQINLRRIFIEVKAQLPVIKEFVASSKWLLVYFVLLAAFQRLDIFMISHFSSTEELANYGVAFRYYAAILLLLGSVHAVLLPMLSKIEMQDIRKQKRFMVKWLKFTVWIVIPILIADLFGKRIFLWISGAQYSRAFLIFIVFSIGIWLSLIFSPLVNLLISRKIFKFLVLLGTGTLIFNFVGNYLLIPIWGGVGAAFITVFSHGLLNVCAGLKLFLGRDKTVSEPAESGVGK